MTNNQNTWPNHDMRSLTELEAFDAMRIFIQAYWERGSKTSDDIANLLSDISRRPGLPPIDIAQWNDWRDAVDKVKGEV